MPRVSVVMPVFNGADYIGKSIASVLGQSMSDLELIVVNDGSTDSTSAVLEHYAVIDSRVKILNRKNSGKPSFPKNDGIAAASGEFLCFLDHDDLYEVDRIEKMLVGLELHSDWVAAFHDVRFIDDAGDYLPTIYLREHKFLELAAAYLTELSEDWFECGERFYEYQAMISGAMHTSSVMIAVKRLPTGILYFDTQYNICDDTDLWIRLGLAGKIGYLNRPLSFYRQHPVSITRNQEKFLLDSVLLMKNSFKRIENLLTPEQRSKFSYRIARALGDIGYLNYRQYRHGQARAAYSEAMSWLPELNLFKGYIKTFIPECLHRGIDGKQAHLRQATH